MMCRGKRRAFITESRYLTYCPDGLVARRTSSSVQQAAMNAQSASRSMSQPMIRKVYLIVASQENGFELFRQMSAPDVTEIDATRRLHLGNLKGPHLPGALTKITRQLQQPTAITKDLILDLADHLQNSPADREVLVNAKQLEDFLEPYEGLWVACIQPESVYR